MNIDELSKLAIAEVEKELSGEINIKKTFNDLEEQFSFTEDEDVTVKINNAVKAKENLEISTYEKIYLKNIKERILVLFEALNASSNDEDLQKRLEITIGFIEFLLASIEDRIKD